MVRCIAFVAAFVFLSARASAQDVLMGLTSNGGPEGKGTAYSIKTDGKGFNVIKGFVNWGENPMSSLLRGTDGYLYGMTPAGGTYGHGTIFRISTSGEVLILKNLNSNVDGGYPHGSLIQATDGNFYGLMSSGPNSGGGVIFKLTSDYKYSILRAFSSADGYWPQGRLTQAADGALYGITRAGGASGYGTIFKYTLSGSYSVLKSFNGTTDGGQSYGSLMQGSDGAFYGMTKYGGTYGYGVIFRYSSVDGYKVIKQLNRNTDAAYPTGDLVQKDSYLYGMSPSGVSYNGIAFKLKLDGTSFSKIHDMGASGEGYNPGGSFVVGSDGYLYGITSFLSGGYGGTIFKMSTSGAVSVLKKLTPATDGENSIGNLIQLPDGSFCGMTQYGGKYANGTVFKLTGTTLTILAHLNGSAQGNVPQENLALAKDSAYFGVTQYGGTYNYGTIFKICGGVTTTLHSFNRNAEGGLPTGGLVRGKDGNLYGMTESGGANGVGTIYKMTPTGTFSVLRSFKGATDGQSPLGTLAINSVTTSDSSLYGVTISGGSGSAGTIFKISQKGTFTVLRNFVYSTDGNGSEGGLTMGTDGYFYGMTVSRFYKIKPDGTSFTVLHTFAYSTEGTTPSASLVRGTDGAFYGTMNSGGASSSGTIFKITTSGAVTVLRSLNGTTDGGTPKGSLIQGSDGAFYGTTTLGGTNKVGTIFRITTAKAFTVLRSFNMATDGGTPLGGLILAPKITLVANAQSGLTTTEDVAKAITLTGSGATNITFNVLIKPRHGSVTTGTAAARTYTPAANFNGVDSFAFTTNLGCLASTPAWVKISVSSVNDAPVITTISNKTVAAGTKLSFLVTATDVDAGQTKTFSLVSPPGGATITTAGTFSWTPSTTGTFTVKLRVTDNGSPVLYSEKSFTVTVTTAALTATSVADESLAAAKVEEQKPAAKISLYPNPVATTFTVTLPETAKNLKLTIVDAKGATVYSRAYSNPLQQVQVDAATLKGGSYLVLLQTENGTQSVRFIKQ